MALKKQYLKTKPVCKVRFDLSKAGAKESKKVYLVGEFNNWNKRKNPMKKQKNGSYSLTIDLEKGKEYQFRYLLDGKKWENDWSADKYVYNKFADGENSVVAV